MTDSAVTLITTKEEAQEALGRFLASDRLLAFDTETTGLLVASTIDKPRTVQLSWRPWSEAIVLPTTPTYLGLVAKFFAHAVAVVGFNTKFDIHALATYGINVFFTLPPESIHDVRWIARLHDERDHANLKGLATQYLRSTAIDGQVILKRKMKKEGWTWGTVPISELVEYGGTDAIITGKLYDFLRPLIGYAEDAYLREQRLHLALWTMERTGVLVDLAMLDAVIEEERTAVAIAEEEVNRLAPGLNMNSPIQLLAAFRARGVTLDGTAKDILFTLDDDLARAILTYRSHAKTLNTYAIPWREVVGPDGRIHPSFNQVGASTGRISSEHPNFQNVPRGHRLRDIITAGPGNKLVVADWNQVELRLYAHFAADENMRAAFISGDDIYQQVADFLGVPRQVGKMVMLASIYGAGWRAIKAQTIAQCYGRGDFDLAKTLVTWEDRKWESMVKRFHKLYRIRDLAKKTEEAARRRGMVGEPYIRTVGGRRQRPKTIKLPAVNGYSQVVTVFKDLSNSLVQGSSADLMKMALVALMDNGWLSELRLTVHDEVVLEVPEAKVDEVIAVLKLAMTRNEFIPALTVNITVADRYGDAK